MNTIVPRSVAAAALMIVSSTFLIVAMNMFGKLVTAHHDPVAAVFYRNLIGLVLVLCLAAPLRGRALFRTARLGGHVIRSLLGNFGTVIVFWAYALMPMADVTVIMFTSPLFVTLLAIPMLGEKVGPWRWGAVMVGFAGMLLATNPPGAGFVSHYGVLIALAASFSVAMVNIFLRSLGQTEDAWTTVVYFFLIGTAGTGVYMLFNGAWPVREALWPLLGVGICGASSQLIKTQAHRIAEASFLSPLNYTSIVWATLFGYLVWGDVPTLSVAVGAAIIIASNLFIVHREHKHNQVISGDVETYPEIVPRDGAAVREDGSQGPEGPPACEERKK